MKPDAEVIGAIRLALEASADARTLRKVLTAILGQAAPTNPWSTEAVAILIDAVKEARAEFVTTEAEPTGRLRKVQKAKRVAS